MRKSPTLSPKKCLQCGETYQPAGTRQFYCPSCGAERDLQRKREYEMRKHPNRKPKQKCTDVCCVCGGPFSCRFDGKPYCNKHYLRMRNNGDAELHPRKRTNTYSIHGDVTAVKTSKGQEFIIDTADLEAVQRYSWCYSKTGYLVANTGKAVVKLHRYLLNPDPGVIVDHINGDPSDNRRCNLRLCSQKENSRNCGTTWNSKTGVVGVKKVKNRYVAQIMVDRKHITIGSFPTLELATAARAEAEKHYFGEFAPSISRT